MSIQAICWAYEQEPKTSPQKFVLVTLGNYADENGMAYPSVATLCSMTLQHDDTVRDALKELQIQGFIKDTGLRFGPTQQVKKYLLKMPKSKTPGKRGLTLEDPVKTRSRPGQDPGKAGSILEREPGTVFLTEHDDKNGTNGTEAANLTGRYREKKSKSKKSQAPAMTGGAAGGADAPTHYTEFVRGWFAAFEEHFGHKPTFNGGDGKAVKQLLSTGLTPERLLEVAKQAWQHPDWFNCKMAVGLRSFASRFSHIEQELKNPPGKRFKQPSELTATDVLGGRPRSNTNRWVI